MPKAKAFASIAIPFWCNSSKISRAECPVANMILLASIFVPFCSSTPFTALFLILISVKRLSKSTCPQY
jgi:hypothetical protein